jgi:hypothetical protein
MGQATLDLVPDQPALHRRQHLMRPVPRAPKVVDPDPRVSGPLAGQGLIVLDSLAEGKESPRKATQYFGTRTPACETRSPTETIE